MNFITRECWISGCDVLLNDFQDVELLLIKSLEKC
jgi:hypothetical protein